MPEFSAPQAGIWRHYKGNRYLVLGLGRHTETGEEVVVYIPLHTNPEQTGPAIQCRPLAMWWETVLHEGERVERFAWEGARR